MEVMMPLAAGWRRVWIHEDTDETWFEALMGIYAIRRDDDFPELHYVVDDGGKPSIEYDLPQYGGCAVLAPGEELSAEVLVQIRGQRDQRLRDRNKHVVGVSK